MKISAYWELVKPRPTSMACLAALLGYFMASKGRPEAGPLVRTVVGCFLVGGGAATLNQCMERENDARMIRTSSRPLPSGRISLEAALVYGTLLSLLGIMHTMLAVNPVAAAVALAMHLIYVFGYTPLKSRTYLSAWVGAVAGALPPVYGWAACAGRLEPGAFVLFLILFVWQFPHIFAIGWMYREDYNRGGMCVLAEEDPDGRRTWRQMTAFSFAMLVVSALPYAAGMAGRGYLAAALAVSAAFLGFAASLRTPKRLNEHAVHLLFASVVYLPVIILAMMADKRP